MNNENTYLKIQDILDICKKSADVSRKCYESALNGYVEKGNPDSLNAMAYFKQKHQLYSFEIPNLIKSVADEYGITNLNNGWINIQDRLPSEEGSYLVVGKTGGATVTRWYAPSKFHPEGHFGGNSAEHIRYWMPRPVAPKK